MSALCAATLALALMTPVGARTDDDGVGLLPMPAADEARGDGIYGRFAGDVSWSLGVGAEYDGRSASLRPDATFTLRFYQAVGLAATFSQTAHTTDPIERRLGVALVLEPLFLIRWPNFQHTGKSVLDLTIDSLGLWLGASFFEPKTGNFADQTALSLGLGAGVPLLGRAEGPWIRGRVEVSLGLGEPIPLGLLTLEWQGFWNSPLIDHP